MLSRLLRALPVLAVLALFSGCGGVEEPAARADAAASASPTEAAASDVPESSPAETPQETSTEGSAEGDGTLEGTGYERVRARTGDTIDMILPPSALGDTEAPSEVSMTFGRAYVAPSSLTKGNVFVTVDLKVRNTGDRQADLRSLDWSWQGRDGLYETGIGVFCENEVEYDLPVGARTEGCFMVDVPRDPGTLTLETMDKTVTIELTRDLVES